MAQLQFGDVFDGHQALVGVDQLAEDVQQRGLAGAGAAADQDIAALAHGLLQELVDRLVDGLHGHQVSAVEHVLAEFSDRQARPVECNRRNDRVDPAAVRQARIDHRRRLIEPPAEGREDALDDALDMVRIDEPQVAQVQYTIALDEHAVRAVDQDFGDCRITQQHFQRAETCELVDDLFGQALHLVARDRQVQARDVFGHFVDDELRQHLARAFEQVFPGLFDGIDDVAVQHQFQAFVVGIAGHSTVCRAEQFFAAHGVPLRRLNQDLGLARLSERLARHSPRLRRLWVSTSRGASSNRVTPWFLAFKRTSGL
ncbi:hypothetical protein D3C76_844840 [compost metagenome]